MAYMIINNAAVPGGLYLSREAVDAALSIF